VSRLSLIARVHKNYLEFISERKYPLSKLNCKKIFARENYFVCKIPLPKNLFYGVNSFLINLPKNVDVQLGQYGLHTRVLAGEKWMDYFEIGGPIRGTLSLEIEVINLGKGGNLYIAIPQTNSHQKLISFNINYPYELLTNGKNPFASITLPKMGSKKIFNVKAEFTLELRGLSLWSLCKGNKCYLIKEREVKYDPLDDWGVFNDFIYNLSLERHIHSVLKKLLEFINGNIRYRSNPERFGALYALKMGIGACDEISDLSVRSLDLAGYNARFVKGFYIENYNKVQGHAWVEVQTEKGWLPFDPTGKILGIGMRWIKFIHETEKRENLIKISDTLKLKSVRVNFN